MNEPAPIRSIGELDRERKANEVKAREKRHARRADALYVAGAALVTLGAGMIRFYLAPIAAGCFCLVFPAIDLLLGFSRGARAAATPRQDRPRRGLA